jgi:hypothetical protein
MKKKPPRRFRGEGKGNWEKMLTKVALDSVFPHANENCETRTTLAESTKEKEKEKGSQEKVHERDENAFESRGDLNCTYRVADNCDTATRRLPCCRKSATEPMANADHFFSSHRSVKQRAKEKKERRNQMHTFADDAASNAFDISPEATSLITNPRALHARTRIRTQNAPTFCDKSHSLIVQTETTRRAFENTISVATRPDTL